MAVNTLLGIFFGFACSIISLKSLKTEDEYKSKNITFENNKKIYIINMIMTGIAFGVADSFLNNEKKEVFIIMSLFLAMASATDYFDKIVQDRIHIISSLCIMIVLYINGQLKSGLIEGIGITTFMLLVFIFSKGKLGGADVKIFFPIGLSIGLLKSIDTLLLASLVTIISGIIRKIVLKTNIREWEFPFIPYIYMGFILSCFIDIYGHFLGV